MKILVAARFKACVCGRSLAGIAGSNTAEAWMSVPCQCYVLSGRGLYDGPIPVLGSTTECVFVSFSVIRCNNNLYTYNE